MDDNEIIMVVLEVCMGRACKMSAILSDERVVPLVATDGKSHVVNVVRAVATVGWLYCRGRTNSAWYQTTVKGKEALGELKAKTEQVR